MSITFENLNLDSRIIAGLNKQNISVPTSIQQEAIPVILNHQDVIAQSHTGSGKTLAFVAPLFEKIDTTKREMQVLILAPTHELVMQIDAQIKLLAANSEIPVTSTTIIGGANIDKQIKKLKEKPHIITGSCGRILELIKKKKITAHTLKTIILDEADSLLDNTNTKTIQDIIKTTLRDRQLCLFSASISENTQTLATSLMKEPVILKTADAVEMNPNIAHFYLKGERRDKFELLRKLIVAENPERALIFVNQNDSMQEIAEKLNYHQKETFVMRGNIQKEERKRALDLFRSGKIKLLVSSDLTARGLDIPEVTHIIHLDCPANPNEYLHRAGRTARGYASGKSICIITDKDLSTLKKYQKKFNIQFKEMKVSHGQFIEA
ncbi:MULTISPECIES: DEAD/DEAH box helicase [Turicibacter]|jgi:DEAD/DEAH box helicase|uniref:DEAD/DEAH box helicase n=1 Tax=Turicibacter TaxID=191303 RepID=UPI0006C58C86|nr:MULTISPECIES: DEAD/DEAH box helicase [Turicibacter]MBP3902907.1 DEAD/DEAH box helicase [Turicibacter sp.]MCU7190068.1 DEAD/DEAH box helicase [Turicibacter sanguinis]MCU7195912.1 DEAD/DEAH box helicase [Turicibacter sanguinis]MCU7210888.1 DEAD/DEAH box helicase [Turicibacter sanguinis]MDB8437432.1 DEAD/DEAH box helicase [Turicibacter sanguinis]